PLESEIGGAHDQDALGQAAQLEFANQEARHDRLSGAGVVRQQETHACELQQVVVDGLELMRQRIHPRDRQPEVRIELVGDTERISLQSEAEKVPIAVERTAQVQQRQPV